MAISVGTLSYAAAAAAYCFLTILLVSSWRGRLPGALLSLASLLTAVWAGAMSYQASHPESWKLPGELLEVAHKAGWFLFLLVLLGYARQADRAADKGLQRVALIILGSCGAILLLIIALRLPADSALLRESRFYTSILAPGILALVGMLLVEHLYRNTSPQQRWSVKFLCLGLGAYFAFDFYLFSDAMLFRRVSPEIWSARGVVIAIISPLIAVSAARNPLWSLDVFVSRRIVFHSTTLLGASAYLLIMAVAGYYIRYFDGTWGGMLQATFLFGAGVLLVLMLFSGTVRARLKVFLSQHFFTYRYDYREEWLGFTRTLSQGGLDAHVHERCLEALGQLVESPGGALWMHNDRGSFERAAHWNMPLASGTETKDGSFVRFLARGQTVINLDDVERTPEAYDGLVVPPWLQELPQAWLVIPLFVHDELAGFVVLARSRGRIVVNWEVSDLLKTAALQVATYVAQAQASDALARAKQFDSFNKMTAFVVHDLKNLVAQLSLLLRNAQRHRHNPAFQEDMLGTIESSVAKMNRILMHLRSGGLPIEQPVPILTDDVLARAVEAKAMYRPTPRLEIVDALLWVSANAERLERVVGHLVQNAIEATPADGRVSVSLRQREDSAVIEVADTGKGMSQEFVRDALFKPFESTKRTGMGIGTYESREYIRELGGKLEVFSEVGRGSRFEIVLPLVDRGRAAEQTRLRQGVA